MNKAIITGNLGADPEVRYTQSGQAVCTLRVATNERWNDANGNRVEHTEWHRVVLWGARAENAQKYLVKGSKVAVEGRLRTREWQDQNGITRYTTEINADNVEYLDSRGINRQQPGQVPPPPNQEPSSNQVPPPPNQAHTPYQVPQPQNQIPDPGQELGDVPF